jgi:hypothetical protein
VLGEGLQSSEGEKAVVARALPSHGSDVVGLEQGCIKVQVEDNIGVVVSGAASSDGFSTGRGAVQSR